MKFNHRIAKMVRLCAVSSALLGTTLGAVAADPLEVSLVCETPCKVLLENSSLYNWAGTFSALAHTTLVNLRFKGSAVSAESVARLANPDVQKALRQLPPGPVFVIRVGADAGLPPGAARAQKAARIAALRAEFLRNEFPMNGFRFLPQK